MTPFGKVSKNNGKTLSKYKNLAILDTIKCIYTILFCQWIFHKILGCMHIDVSAVGDGLAARTRGFAKQTHR
jgi:hypothetical protein